MLGGVLLHSGPAPPRRLALAGASLLSAQCILPYAVRRDEATVLIVAGAALGIGYGIIYVLSLAVVQAWVPERPGTATGMAIFAGGVGTLFFVVLDTKLANTLATTDKAIGTVGALQTVIAVVAASFVCMPPYDNWHPAFDLESCQVFSSRDWHNPSAKSSCSSIVLTESSPALSKTTAHQEYNTLKDHCDSALAVEISSSQSDIPSTARRGCSITSQSVSSNLLENEPRRLSVGRLLQVPSFYVLLIVYLASVGPGFGVILHGSRMQRVLTNVATTVADRRFFIVTLVGVAGRLIVGIVVDLCAAYIKFHNTEQSAAFSSAHLAMKSLLFMQTLALALSFLIIRLSNAILFFIVLMVVYFTFSGATTVVACLCRSMFSRENSTLAFSLLGFAVGIGDIIFGGLVATSTLHEQAKSGENGVARGWDASHVSDYNAFFITATVLSLTGFVLSFFLSLRESYHSESNASELKLDSSKTGLLDQDSAAGCGHIS